MKELTAGTQGITGNRVIRIIYTVNIFMLVLTGFGQMPIYKRYYMSDIPGFSWLANFLTTRYVHYLLAVLLLALVAYIGMDYLVLKRKDREITATGYVRIALLAGIVFTGILFVIKNFPPYIFSPNFIIFLNLSHLGFVMAFLLVSLFCVVVKKKWTTSR